VTGAKGGLASLSVVISDAHGRHLTWDEKQS
jgi:hypothetical protein